MGTLFRQFQQASPTDILSHIARHSDPPVARLVKPKALAISRGTPEVLARPLSH